MDISEDLYAKVLERLKYRYGDLNKNSELDGTFYDEAIFEAVADMKTEDICKEALESDYGQTAITFAASLIINQMDLATNPTLNLMKNKLSAMTKGEDYA